MGILVHWNFKITSRARTLQRGELRRGRKDKEFCRESQVFGCRGSKKLLSPSLGLHHFPREMAEKQEIRQPPRPTITLPPRPSMESLAGFTYSHGHVTPVSSFFSHNFPESSPDFRSFSRPLAGAMNSPLAAMASVQSPLFASNTSDAPLTEAKSGDGAEKDSGLKQKRPMSSAVARSPLFTVPPGLIPSGLPYLPGLFYRQVTAVTFDIIILETNSLCLSYPESIYRSLGLLVCGYLVSPK